MNFCGFIQAKIKRNKNDRKIIRFFQLKTCNQFFDKALHLLKSTEEERKILAKSLKYFINLKMPFLCFPLKTQKGVSHNKRISRVKEQLQTYQVKTR